MKTLTGIRIVSLLLTSLLLIECVFPSSASIFDETIIPIEKMFEAFQSSNNVDGVELQTTIPKIIQSQGYPVEEHEVLTEDGYMLTMHRIPGPVGSPPVFLQHGILDSSLVWVIAGKNRSLAFVLADQGYDVWLGNSRGNKYSMSNVHYKRTDSRFWNFSWHENGIYDLPAEISYISQKTKEKITYIGTSMGTTMFFVFAIEKPEIAENVKIMFVLAPVAFLQDIMSPVKWVFLFVRQLASTLNWFFASDINFVAREFCADPLLMMRSFLSPQLPKVVLSRISSENPTCISVKTLVHYVQEFVSGRFQKYDYGLIGNLKEYGSIEVPDYDLSKVRVPVGIFWSKNDLVADPTDVKRLSKLLPKVIFNHKVADSKFNHLDFLFGIDAYKQVYKDVLIEVNKYR